MEELLFYISAIDANLLNTISGQPGVLIKLVKQHPDANEVDIAEKLFHGKHSKQYFLNTKIRTLKILRSYLFVSPPKNSSILQKKIWTARRKYATAMIFIESHRREMANKLLRQAFSIASEFGLTRIAFDCANELLVAASINRKKDKFLFYQTEANKLIDNLKAEQIVKEFYYGVILEMNSKRGSVFNLMDEDIKMLDELECQTPSFLKFYYSLRIASELSNGHYSLLKQTTTAAISKFLYKKGTYSSSMQLFYKSKAIAEIALNNYDSAGLLLTQAQEFAPDNSYNQAIIKFYQAINALHAGNFPQAYECYRENRKTKFGTLNEQWLIMGAYLYFLKKTGHLETGTDRFSIGKYLNETTASSHDKRGSNVNILIGELLVNLVKNRSRFINRVEAINNYSYKYLKGADTQRAKWFIRFLCLIPRANFHPAAIQRIGKKYLDKLENHQVALGDNLSVEMIPFQILWKIIEGYLTKSRTKSTYQSSIKE